MPNAGNATISGILTENSDRNEKTQIESVDTADILTRIASLDISEWSYLDTPGERHIGPMAQDFYAAFGLGRDNKHIATLDSSGVALAGIQALIVENRLLRERIVELEAQNTVIAELEDRQARTEALLMQLVQSNSELLAQAVNN